MVVELGGSDRGFVREILCCHGLGIQLFYATVADTLFLVGWTGDE